MDIKKLIKDEFAAWEKFEIITTSVVLIAIFISAFIAKDSILAVLAAIFGILYTILAGKGRLVCFYFGIIGSTCYAMLSFDNHLWGQFLLYLGYYVPIEIIGLIKWKKNLKKGKQEIIKTKLTKKELITFSIIAFVCSAICIYILAKYTDDASPILDGITPVVSIIGMYLTVKRCIEQWIIWMFVNGATTIIWLHAIFLGATVYSAAIMWAFYFILAFYFFFQWKKEVKF